MKKTKLTRKDIERTIPPMDKESAIEQAEKYAAEYKRSEKEFDEMMEKLKELYKEE